LDNVEQSESQDPARSAAIYPDAYVLAVDDSEMVSHILGGQNFSYSVSKDGKLTWGAFGKSFATLGELREIALEHPAPPEEPPLPTIVEQETVGLELFGNMLDTISFLRVRLRALADVVIEKGLVSGPELLGKYHEYHERSFQAFRDLMLLRPEVFDQRFAEWLATEKEYREQLAADSKAENSEVDV
jgi:hypothetical protein